MVEICKLIVVAFYFYCCCCCCCLLLFWRILEWTGVEKHTKTYWIVVFQLVMHNCESMCILLFMHAIVIENQRSCMLLILYFRSLSTNNQPCEILKSKDVFCDTFCWNDSSSDVLFCGSKSSFIQCNAFAPFCNEWKYSDQNYHLSCEMCMPYSVKM